MQKLRSFLRLSILLALTSGLHGESVSPFIEKFALSSDREAVLGQLIPGSEDFYFFTALHFQNTRQKDQLAATLDAWAKRYPQSVQREMLENRSALINYEADPQATLALLRKRLNLQFNHAQETPDKKPDLPTVLDPQRISRATFQKESIQAAENLSQCQDAAIEALVREKFPLNPGQTRSVLARLTRPDLPNLVELIETNLRTLESRGFGEFTIHRALLGEQLDALAKRIPTLRENSAFVLARLSKLAPSADANVQTDAVERDAWLSRAWEFASDLAPVFNSLKASILYQQLQADQKRGVYDSKRFLAYLKLPRRVGYVNEAFLNAPEQQRAQVDLNANFGSALPVAQPIGNDEGFVRELFLEFFQKLDAGSFNLGADEILKPYASWVRVDWLRPILAEAMITGGLGAPERWTSLLAPAAYQALKDRIDLDFASTNAPVSGLADEVTIDLFLKNVPEPLVKVYEINLLSYFLNQTRQLNTDLPLDGLVANREVTYDFADAASQSPFRRTVRTFKFPEMKGQRGAWIVEFIGGGKASRALIRKGEWSVIQEQGAAGDMLTVLDEKRQPVEAAVVWLEGRKLTRDAKSGSILVPFTEKPGIKPIILADPSGEFASLAQFEHHAERYHLDGQFYLHREQLLAGREATLAMRVGLLLGQATVPTALLKEMRLSITLTTLDGVATTSQIPLKDLNPAKDFTFPFTVPERLGSIKTTLTAKVENLSKGGAKDDLVAERTWDLNGIDQTDLVSDGYLSKIGGGYLYQLLGRNGEPMTDQQIVFEFTHRDFQKGLTIPMKTNAKGQVILGVLAGVQSVKAKAPNGRGGDWRLEEFHRTWPAAIHGVAGEVIKVPIPPGLARRGGKAGDPADETLLGSLSLLEVRGGTFTKNEQARIKVVGGFLAISGLTGGDYSLRFRDESTVEILLRVTAGKVVGNWLESRNRALEMGDARPLQVQAVRVTADALTIQLANWGPLTRVHLAASRFLPGSGLFDLGIFRRFNPGWRTPVYLPNLFAAGREIGDEYRYILDRRSAKVFPGNMLARPSLILNPWEVRSTDLQEQNMVAMDQANATAGNRMGNVGAASSSALGKHYGLGAAGVAGADLDFLALAGPTVFNLVPDAQGVVRVDLKVFGDRQQIQVYAEDSREAIWETFALGEKDTALVDRRLAKSLDAGKALTEKKQTTVLKKGETLVLADILTSELEVYDSLAGVYGLMATLSKNPTLAKFRWILDWPQFQEEEKRSKYSEFACHELSFFLSKKDRPFFEKVVAPYLKNKKDRTFIDDYLLGNDLRPYLDPWSFARLNAAEQGLLAERLPKESAGLARHLRDLWELLPPDAQRADFLFETALHGRSIEPGKDKGGFRDMRRGEAEKQSQMAASLDKKGDFQVTAMQEMQIKDSAPPPPGVGGSGGKPMARLAMPRSESPVATAAMSAVVVPSEGESLGKREELAEDEVKSESAVLRRLDGKAAETLRESVRPFFRALGPTKEWAENQYYQLPIAEQGGGLIAINAFWRDYSAEGGKAPFVSAKITETTGNFSEMMLALSVLDLPFQAEKHQNKSGGREFTLTASGPLIAFHKEIQPAILDKKAPELLVTQNFYRQGDRYREEGNERFDKYVSGEFIAGVVYGANIVLTNPSSAAQKLEILLQIPQGSIAVMGSKPTESRSIRMEPYTTQTLGYFFYFPAVGARPFTQYPVNLSLAGQSVGAAQAVTFLVVNQLSKVDEGSWEYLSQSGSDAQVLAYIGGHNIERINLERIAWRVGKSKDFFKKIIGILGERHHYSGVIYGYSVVHNDAASLGEWLRHQDAFLGQCGPLLQSKLLEIDPIERRTYQHLEYSPLVNQRVLPVGGTRFIPNPVFREQYYALLNLLAYKPTLDPIDEMSVVYYLFLQDRVEEALPRLQKVKAELLPTKLEYDYFRAYGAFYEENLAAARGLANQYVDYPVDRWRKLFAEVGEQIDEIEGKVRVAGKTSGKEGREATQAQLAESEPTFDFKVENRQVSLTWRNLREVTVNYYRMDPEFLFSSSPFVTQDAGRVSMIKPNQSLVEKLPAGKGAKDFGLPADLMKANILVEVLGAGQRKAQTYHSNTFRLLLAENYGRLEVRDAAEDRPLSKAYVKVYARLGDGTVRFFKDGYTDLRGKFDYASLNSSGPTRVVPLQGKGGSESGSMSYQMLRPEELSKVEKLSILVLSKDHGATVREVSPPSE